jgi:hypothetical protein
MATALSVAAIAVALFSLAVSIWSAKSSARSADASQAVDRRERTPILSVLLNHPAPAPDDRVIYRVRNDGPQDLGSVKLFRPRPPDGIAYPLARTGDPGGWADDQVELGPLAMTQEAAVTFCCGAGEDLPIFRLRAVCRSADDTWDLLLVLPDPRSGAVRR